LYVLRTYVLRTRTGT